MRKRLSRWVLFTVVLLAVNQSGVLGQDNQDRPIPDLSADLRQSPGRAKKAQLLVELALAYVHKPGEDRVDLDSAVMLVGQAQTIIREGGDEETGDRRRGNGNQADGIGGNQMGSRRWPMTEARSYYVLANALRERSDTAGGHRAIDESIKDYEAFLKNGTDSAERLRCYGELGDARMERAQYYNTIFEESIEYRTGIYKEALEAYRKAGLKDKQGFTLKNIADLNMINSEFPEAMMHLREALAIYQEIHYKNLQGVYDLLGRVSTMLGDFPNAVNYGLLAVRTAQTVADTSMQLCTIYFRLSNSYENWSHFDEAMEYRQRAMAIARKYRNTDAIIVILPGLTGLMNREQKWKESVALIRHFEDSLSTNKNQKVYLLTSYVYAWLAGKRFEEANQYTRQLITLIKGYSVSGSLFIRSYSCIAYNFLMTGQYRMSEKYAKELLHYCIEIEEPKGQMDAYLFRSRADSALSDYHSALMNYHRYHELADSLLGATKNLQFADMTIRYETEKKEQDIKLKQQNIETLKSKGLLQDAELKKAGLIRNVIVLSALFLLLILYTGYRFKQRHNNRLQAQQKEIREQNERLAESLSVQRKMVGEKEWLLKEIHHRVKNNLQIVISLLNAQSEFLDSPSAIAAIRESQERMQAIAIIHQRLYQHDESTAIDMQSYIREMVIYLGNSLADAARVSFRLDIDKIDLDVSQAVPLGLILNEAVTNAVKYAFPAGKTGVVHIVLKETETGILLRIADDGQGFFAPLDVENHESLGFQLMRLFSDQLEGILSFDSGKGVVVTLCFHKYIAENTIPASLKLG